jgi:integrase
MVSDGRVFNISENKEWWTKALDEAGIKNFRWHDLRHTTATRAALRKMDPFSIAKLMGHSNIQTTMIYVHLAESILSAIEKIPAEAESIAA